MSDYDGDVLVWSELTEGAAAPLGRGRARQRSAVDWENAAQGIESGENPNVEPAKRILSRRYSKQAKDIGSALFPRQPRAPALAAAWPCYGFLTSGSNPIWLVTRVAG